MGAFIDDRRQSFALKNAAHTPQRRKKVPIRGDVQQKKENNIMQNNLLAYRKLDGHFVLFGVLLIRAFGAGGESPTLGWNVGFFCCTSHLYGRVFTGEILRAVEQYRRSVCTTRAMTWYRSPPTRWRGSVFLLSNDCRYQPV